MQPLSQPAMVNPSRAVRERMCGQDRMCGIAITAIDAISHGSLGRDISIKASVDDVRNELSTMDDTFKETFAKVSKDVVVRAEALEKEGMVSATGLNRKAMPGVTGPLDFFDPLGFSTDCSDGKLLFYREVELKHGRVGMLAALGLLVGEQFHPLFGGDVNVPSYIAFQQTPLQTFWPAVVLAIAIPEIFSIFSFQSPLILDPKEAESKELWSIRTDHEPGNLGFDPLGLKPTNPAELKEMQNKELNNGRLAMIAAAGMIAQELASGQKLF